MYIRSIDLEKQPKCSFFLWGPRQTGKSSLLKTTYPDAVYIDLLKTDEFIKYQKEPHRLRQELLFIKPSLVIIDEIQKAPLLLNEVHWLIENQSIVFILCGSSARKVKQGHANLLGGRALRYELFGMTVPELKEEFNLKKILNNGYLPRHYQMDNAFLAIQAYCADYLKEEIAAEGLVRNLPQFSNFLDIAALSDTEMINFATIARECGVSAPTARAYFELLVDTLMGYFLEPYTKRPKRRTVTAIKKFYFFDVGIVNYLAKRGELNQGSELFGKAFENWVHHEIKTYLAYRQINTTLSYWRLSTGVEVDFIIGNMEYAIEVKATSKITSDHLKGLRELKKDYPEVKLLIIVCLEARSRLTEDGIQILNYADFIKNLWHKNFLQFNQTSHKIQRST